MPEVQSIEIGQTLAVLIEQVDQDRVEVRLPDGSLGYIYRREWMLDDRNQQPNDVFKLGAQIRATVLHYHRGLAAWELGLRRVRAWEQAAHRFKKGATVDSVVKDTKDGKGKMKGMGDKLNADQMKAIAEYVLTMAK